MKILYFTLLVAFLFCSCSKDDFSRTDGNPQEIALNFCTKGDGAATWINGDEIGIFVTSENNPPFFTYRFNGTSWATPQGYSPLTANLPAKLIACYSGSNSQSYNSFSVIPDQTVADKLHKSNWMTSDEITCTSTSLTSIELKHRLCRVKVTISGYGNEFGSSSPAVTDFQFHTLGSLVNYREGVYITSGSTESVSPLVTTDPNGLNSYEAIVPPGVYPGANNVKIITLKVNGTDYPVTYSGTFESGKSYTFSLQVGHDLMTIKQVSVSDWTDSGTTITDRADFEPTFAYYMALTQAERNTMTSIVLDGPGLTADDVTNYMQGNFVSFFPNVTSIYFTGASLTQKNLLKGNTSVKTVAGDITSLGDYVFNNGDESSQCGVVTFSFPKLTTIGDWCFDYCYSVVDISLPSVIKIGDHSMERMSGLLHVCLDKFYDFTDGNGGAYTKFIFSYDNMTDLAFGTEEEMILPSSAEMKNLLGGPMYDGSATNTTLYLNGYEYQHANIASKTWRGITFQNIKNYSEYPYQKD